MKEVCNALDEVKIKADYYKHHFFVDAAAKWADYVVRTNCGSALDAGLDISKAMVKYADAIGLTGEVK